MAEILLISSDWQMRTLARAELLEEGYEVKAWPSLEAAMAHLIRSDERPALTIVDAEGIETEPQVLSDLWQLTGRAPLLLCGGLLDRRLLDEAGLPPLEPLLRPFSVGELTERVRRLLGQTAGG